MTALSVAPNAAETSATAKKQVTSPQAKSSLTAASQKPVVQKSARPDPVRPTIVNVRARVARARDLTSTKVATTRDAIGGVIGKVLGAFTLAQISILQRDADTRDEIPAFYNDPDSAAERPWQTYANLMSDKPDKAVTAPVTFSTDVKMGLAALFIGIADLVNATGKLPAADSLAPLLASQTLEGSIVRLMAAVTTQMRPRLYPDPMNCDLGYPTVLRQKLVALIDDKKFVDPGAEPLTQLYFSFLKIIAWHAAVIAYEHEHLTLNRPTLYAILAQMESSVPNTEVYTVRDVLSFVRSQVEKLDHVQAQAKAAKAKPKKPVLKKASVPAKKTAIKTAPAAAKAAPGPSPDPLELVYDGVEPAAAQDST